MEFWLQGATSKQWSTMQSITEQTNLSLRQNLVPHSHKHTVNVADFEEISSF